MASSITTKVADMPRVGLIKNSPITSASSEVATTNDAVTGNAMPTASKSLVRFFMCPFKYGGVSRKERGIIVNDKNRDGKCPKLL